MFPEIFWIKLCVFDLLMLVDFPEHSACAVLFSLIHTFDGQMLRQAPQLLTHTSPNDASGIKHK